MENYNSIQLAELKQLLEVKQKKVKIIDVRSAEEFNELHIPNSENIQLPQLITKEFSADADEIFITVCTHGGGRSQNAAVVLKEKGIINVKFLEAGTMGWYEK